MIPVWVIAVMDMTPQEGYFLCLSGGESGGSGRFSAVAVPVKKTGNKREAGREGGERASSGFRDHRQECVCSGSQI